MLFVFAVVSAIAWSVPALAQTTVPPDVVVLYSGAMARGTVMEVVPGETVVLLLPDGRRTSFAPSDVRYAGPADGAPGAWIDADASSRPTDAGVEPARRRTVTDGTVRLQIAGTPGVEAGMSSEEIPDVRLCVAPCETRIASGSYRFGVVLENHFILDRRAHDLSRDSVLSLRFSNRGGLRTAGAVLAFLTLIVSVPLVIAGAVTLSGRNDGVGIGLLSGASVGLSLAFGLGLPLGALNDLFEVRVTP